MEQLGVVEPKASQARRQGSQEDEEELEVQWGGSGGIGVGVDLDEQEDLLRRLFKPHKVRRTCCATCSNPIVEE